MKTIKVKDLIIKIANNEIEQGTKFKIHGYDYIYNNGYIAKADKNKTLERFCISQRLLNEEVEIIEEEPKKSIEKMGFIYKSDDDMQDANNERFRYYINEIIDSLNDIYSILNEHKEDIEELIEEMN